MSETAASVVINTVTVSVVGGTSIVILGVHTGLDYPTMIAALAGAVSALSYLDPGKPFRRALEVFTGALSSAYLSPIFAGLFLPLLKKFGFVDQSMEAPQGLQLGMAFLTAYLAQGVILPGIRTVMTKVVGRYSQ